MKAMVVYDSKNGNTEQIVQVIGETIGAQVHRAGDVDPAGLKGYDLLILGSPTHGGRPTEAIHGLIEGSSDLDGVSVAAFDTRTVSVWNRIFRFGHAAPRIAQSLERKGGNLLAPPEGFVVQGIQGPLKDGERERAAGWAKEIAR